MENKSLLSTDENSKVNGYLMNSKNKRVYMPSYSFYVFFNIMILCILLMQIFIITYLILLGKYAQELDLFNFNITETQDYIAKFKIIIDNVCGSFINCTIPK